VSDAITPAKAFASCPRCGTVLPPAEATRYISCPSCDFRLYFNIGVAVAALLANDDGQILFVCRARDPAKGKLGVPGGFADSGESAEETLKREVREETGLELTDIQFLASFPNIYPYRGIAYPTIDFYFTANTCGTTHDSDDEVADLVWLDPSAVNPQELAFESLRQALRTYVERVTS
jgi:ADP-ribose pyrophosphatase YjhB (NUDIX family)